MVTCSTLFLSAYRKKYVIIKPFFAYVTVLSILSMIVEINYDLNRFYRLKEWEICKLTVDSLPLFKNVDDEKLKPFRTVFNMRFPFNNSHFSV